MPSLASDETIFVIATFDAAFDQEKILLNEVFGSERWLNICNEEIPELYLIRTTNKEFQTFENAMVVSYRWEDVISEKDLDVKYPGEEGTIVERRSCDLAVDFVRAVKTMVSFEIQYMWIDFVSILSLSI